MPSEVFVVGLNWRTAPVSVREKIAFHDEELVVSLQSLLEHSLIDEVLILSTCNRVEIYGCTSKSAPASSVAQAAAGARVFLSESRGFPAEMLSEHLYEHLESDAVTHIFQVASALDSMVVGESQILGQLKSAFGVSTREGAVSGVLGRCMERAFAVAKRVRTETGISRGAANVSSVAVELAKRVFGELHGKSVLVVGAGKMSALAARHLRADGAAQICITNRSPEKSQRLAEEIDGVCKPWKDLEFELAKADVVIFSTGARESILSKNRMKRAMKLRRGKPSVVVDIAVPRDVDMAVGSLEGVYLFDIDDLERLVSENLKERSKEASAAERVVAAEVEIFANWLRHQHVVPTIRALRDQFHDVAMKEVVRSMHVVLHASTDSERERALHGLGKSIANKLLHAPMNALKHGEEADELAQAVCRLFSLRDDSDDDSAQQSGVLVDAATSNSKRYD